MLNITLKDGSTRMIKLNYFPALDGWEYQRGFVEFAVTTDPKVRQAYTMLILSYAEVVMEEQCLPLKTSALIENHLQTWENIKAVFEGVLLHNGIDPKTHAEQPNYWAKAGEEMAVSFIAAASKLIGPALQMVERNKE